MNHLVFNGKDFADFSAQVLKSDFLKGAEKDITASSVLGRHGDLIVDNGRFKNLTLNTQLAVTDHMQINMDAMRSFLSSCDGYCRYEESLYPNHFRMAEYHSEFAPNQYDHLGGTVTLKFSAKPQRYLKTGEAFIPFTADGAIYNPTAQIALPVVRVVGNGSFTIGNVTVTIEDSSLEYIDIDCEMMLPHCGATSARSYVTTTNHLYPSLHPGSNGITLNGVTLKIMPRWWEV